MTADEAYELGYQEGLKRSLSPEALERVVAILRAARREAPGR